MKRILTFLVTAATLLGCSHDEAFTPNTPTEKATYYASFADAEADSRTYLDENFMLLWHNDDRISLFTTTYNEEYKFADPTGSNAGKFEAIDNDSWVTGNPVSTTYAVYPYNEHNALSNSEILTIHFPAEQAYAEKSFGRGANTMVAAAQSSTSRLLPFRNAGGFLMLKLYGEGAVKSITLEGNNDEILSGAATAQAKYGYLPLITMGNEGGKTITLTCEEAVELGATEAEATVFWLVVPPITFEEGFTITVTDEHGGTFTRSTSKEVVIERNEIKSMSALNPTFEGETEDPETPDTPTVPSIPANEVWYKTKSGDSVMGAIPWIEGLDGGPRIVSNSFDSESGYWKIVLDQSIAKMLNINGGPDLLEIIMPNSITEIDSDAFCYYSGLTSITIPNGVTKIGAYAFSGCSGLTSIMIPNGVTNIGAYAFSSCESLINISIPNTVVEIGEGAFSNCTSLTTITLPNNITEIVNDMFNWCIKLENITIPEQVASIGANAFNGCSSLTSVTIPNDVAEIGAGAFELCSSLKTVYCKPLVPPTLQVIFNQCTLFDQCTSLETIDVPDAALEEYKVATYWANYATYMR